MIPRILHRVWVGGPEPAESQEYARAWQRLNPQWMVHTWNDAQVSDVALHSRDFYEDLPTPVHKADVLRVELVWRFGGVYIDADMEPLRPIEDFVGGRQHFCTPDAEGWPGGAFFGAELGNFALLELIDAFRRRFVLNPLAAPNLMLGPYCWKETLGMQPIYLECAGTTATAYPFHYTEKRLMDDPREREKRCGDSLMIHRFEGSWTKTAKGA